MTSVLKSTTVQTTNLQHSGSSNPNVVLYADGGVLLSGATQIAGVSGSLSVPVGASGTPSIVFTGDTNTGFYSPAADTLGFVQGGNEVARINNSGILLVNTTAATGNAKVQVSGDALFAGDCRLNSINSGPLAGMRNAVINGSFAFGQRATTFVSGANNDDTYNLDRWYVLSDGNDVVDISQTTSVVPTNGKYAIALDVETVNKKFGIAQIIEADNCIGLIGETVTLSFKAKVSATTKLDNVKAAIVAWSGTADTVTSDIISAWNVEGTNPTLIANATYENTPANLNLTTSYATYSITAAVDTASTTNILVFIWSDVTDTTLGDFLYVTDVQLERGPVSTPFERRPIGTELALCQRYYEIHDGQNLALAPRAATAFNTESFVTYPYKVNKRVIPTVSATYTNLTSPSAEPGLTNCRFTGTANNTALGRVNNGFTFDAEL